MFYKPQKIVDRFPGKDEVHARIDSGFGERFHNAEFVLVPLAITHAEHIGKRQSVQVSFWPIGSVNTASYIHHLLRQDSRPFDDLSAGELRDRENLSGTMAGSLHDGCVIQPDRQAAVLWAEDVAEVMNREYETRLTVQGGVVAGRE